MKKQHWTLFLALSLLAMLLLPAGAAPGSQDAPTQLEASDSPVWQRLFIDRKSTEKYPAHLIGSAVDITEPFATQIHRYLQIITTTSKFWQAGKTEPKLTDTLLSVSFQCGISRQHWPVKTTQDDQCAGVTMQSDWLTSDGMTIFTAFINHYWMRSPRVHQQLVSLSELRRSVDEGELVTNITLAGTMKISFSDLQKLSAYFFSHRMITERKLSEHPKTRRQLESYYAHADIPEIMLD